MKKDQFFDKNFYPTPDHVIAMMGFDCDGMVVLEPSAGKGDIVDYLKIHGAKDVLVCERNEDLAHIVRSKAKFIGEDFLKLVPDQISHINMIVMNPPFSNGQKHILHAWDIAPDGCEIYCLLNSQTLEEDRTSRERRMLLHIIDQHGSSEELGQVFATAERKTNVEVGLVKLFKPKTGDAEFEGFFEEEEPEGMQENGIMKHDAVRDVVQRYVSAVRYFDKYESLKKEIDIICKPFGIEAPQFESAHNRTIESHDQFKKELQKKAWKHIFSEMNITKFVTSGVNEKINQFVESQTKIPFTMKNIYRMLEVIVGTREESFDRSLEEAIDNFTQHTHENRYDVEGWKTNSGYMLNRKFIAGNVLERDYGRHLSPRWSRSSDSIEDLVKVTCVVSGVDFNHIQDLRSLCRNVEMQAGVWYEWKKPKKEFFEDYMKGIWKRLGKPMPFEEFLEEYKENEYYLKEFEKEDSPCLFEVKGFLKGTLHMRFKDPKVWEQVNRKYAKIKGQVLPEKMKPQ